MIVNSYTILYMCMEFIICQSDWSPQRVMISQTPSIWEPHISSFGRRNVEKTLPTFEVNFSKLFLLQMEYSWPSKIVAFHIFYISIFVNTTAVVVNSCAILYMCMEVIICQSDRSPQRVMISQTPSIWEPQIRSGGRRNVGKTLAIFGVSFAKSCLLKTGYS